MNKQALIHRFMAVAFVITALLTASIGAVLGQAATPVLPKPRALINPADLRWHEIMLRHAVASDILTLMHWDKAKSKVVSAEPDLSQVPFINGFFRTRPFQNDPILPEGVAAVIGWTGPNALLIEATPDGFEQSRQIVKIIDVAAHEQEPSMMLSTISVSEKEARSLGFGNSSGSPLKIASGAEITLLYDRLIKSGQLPIPASPVEDSGVFQPQAWIIPGYLISRTEFHADLSVPVTFELVNGREKVTYLFHRGEVLALRSSDQSAKGQITFIKVDY